jgi:hypothetical protein
MKTTDFSAKITSSKLKENMNKMFGLNVTLEKYSREQLEDMRNKLRTRMFQQEGRAGINDLLTNETYQKDKAMMALLNTRIKEMLGEDIKKLKDKMVELSEAKKGVRAPKHKIHAQGTAAQDYDGDGKVEKPKAEVWGSRAKAAAKAGKPFEESAKPDYADIDDDGNKKEKMKDAAKDKKAGPKKGVNPFAKKTESKMMPKDKKKTVKESVETKLSFKQMVQLVQESGGQQQIDAVDKALFTWAERVARNKLGEGMKADLYAGLVYERNGGEFEMYDVLSETQK